MLSKPKVDSAAQKELDKAEKQFESFEANLKEQSKNSFPNVPKAEMEQQTKMSNREAQNSRDIYLKPVRTQPCRNKFNEKFRSEYEFQKEYVKFIAENKEIIGEKMCLWTKRFPGIDAEYWEVPANKPVWGPRYLAEQIKNCAYVKYTMSESQPVNSHDAMGQYTGSLTAEQMVNRLDAIPVSDKKSIFIS